MKEIKYVRNAKFIDNVNVVNDINQAVEWLKMGRTIARFEFGDSMQPILKSGEYNITTPITDLNSVNVGDVVLCEVEGMLMTHMVILKSNGNCDTPFFLIGSSNLYIYGWTNKIYGVCKGTNVIELPTDIQYAEEV